MSETKNLIAEEAVEKLQSLTEKSDTCMFASNLSEVPLHVSPMRVQETDYEGYVGLEYWPVNEPAAGLRDVAEWFTRD